MNFKGLKGAGKKDNAHLGAKLHLRRYFLDTYHKDATPLVFDACQAEAVIWTRLRAEYRIKYFGVDRKPKRGRLAIDSARLLENGPLPYDVIDVDTYGSPWKHWLNLLRNVRKPTTVFLTLGSAGGIHAVDSAALVALGLTEEIARRVPNSLRWKLNELSVASALAMSYHYGITPHDTREVIIGKKGNARYFGVRLIPQTEASTNGEPDPIT